MLQAPTAQQQTELSATTLEKTLELLKAYYQQRVSLENFTVSAMKRASTTLVVSGIEKVFNQQPLFLPIKWLGSALSSWAGKKIGKNLVANTASSDIAITREQLAEDTEPFTQMAQLLPEPEPLQQHPLKKVKAIVVTFTDEVKTMVMEVTPETLIQETSATIGSAAVGTALVLVAGPPGWVGIPAYLLLEGSAKSLTAFIGKWCAQQYLGKAAKIPLLEQLHITEKPITTINEMSVEQIVADFQELVQPETKIVDPEAPAIVSLYTATTQEPPSLDSEDWEIVDPEIAQELDDVRKKLTATTQPFK